MATFENDYDLDNSNMNSNEREPLPKGYGLAFTKRIFKSNLNLISNLNVMIDFLTQQNENYRESNGICVKRVNELNELVESLFVQLGYESDARSKK